MYKLTSACLIFVALTACGCPSPPHETPEKIPKPRKTAPEQPSEAVKTRIDQLLIQLEAQDYKEREHAQQELKKLLVADNGSVIKILTKKLANTQDPEVKERLEILLLLREPYLHWGITPAALDAIPNILELLAEDSVTSMRTAVTALAKLRPEASRSILFSILRNSAKNGKTRAVEALVKQADQKVIEGFIKLLPTHASMAKRALERIGTPAIPPLKGVLCQTEDITQCMRAADALAAIGSAGRKVLLEMLGTGSAPAKAAALSALPEHPEAQEAFESALKLLKHEDYQVRFSAAQLLGTIRREESVDALLPVVKDEHDEVRERAIRALANQYSQRAIPTFIEALKDPSSYVAETAVESLYPYKDERALGPLVHLVTADPGHLGWYAKKILPSYGKRAIGPLAQKLKTTKGLLRAELVDAVGEIKVPEAIPVLLAALKDQHHSARATAAVWLGNREVGEAADILIEMLKNDKDPGPRAAAAMALEELGDKRALEPLIAALSDEDADVRSRAAEALWEFPGEKTADALLKAATDDDSRVSKEAIQSLGASARKRKIADTSKVVDTLAKVLRKSSLEGTRSAISILAFIGSEQAFRVLLEFSRNPGDAPIGQFSWLPEALVKTGGQKAIPRLIELFNTRLYDDACEVIVWLGEAAIRPLLESAKSDAPFTKLSSLKALAMLREEKAFDLLLEAMKHENRWVRQYAAQSVALYRDPRAVEPLIALLGDTHEDVRTAAATSLGHLKDRRATEALVKTLLEDNNANVRSKAATALSMIGDERAVGPLVDSLLDDFGDNCEALVRFTSTVTVSAMVEALERSDYWYARGRIASALAATGHKRAIETLLEMTNRPEWDATSALLDHPAPEAFDVYLSVLEGPGCQQREAVLALGQTGDKRAVEPLKKAMSSEDSSVRIAAAAALFSFGDKEAGGTLQQALQSKNPQEQRNAAEALAVLPSREALPWLIGALKSEESEVRASAAKALEQLGDRSALEPLIKAFDHPYYDVRKTVLRAIAKLGGRDDVAELLIEALENDSNQWVRETAQELLMQTTGQNFGWNYQRWRRWLKANRR